MIVNSMINMFKEQGSNGTLGLKGSVGPVGPSGPKRSRGPPGPKVDSDPMPSGPISKIRSQS